MIEFVPLKEIVMRWKCSVIVSVLAVVVAGCEKADPDMKPRGTANLSHRAVNAALVDTYNLEMVDNAVLRQHTLYPYHFIHYSAEFNALGRRDASVLAHHYKRYPGPLNLRQGDEGDGLYQQRVQTLKQWLIDGGVNESAITIADDMPGGDGISSDQVVIILQRMKTARLTGASSPSEGAGSSSNNNSDPTMDAPQVPNP